MIPPPTTSRRFGIPSGESAPVESITRGSSSGNPGSRTADDPAAITQLSNVIVRSPTATAFGPLNRASPVTTSTPRCFARPRRPPVSLETTDSFQASSCSRSTFGLPNVIPCSDISCASPITRAAWSSAFEGMQPTFRQTPPSVS